MALPTHRFAIFKQIAGEFWSNDWMLSAPGMDEAVVTGLQLVEFERRLHHTDVQFMYYICSTTLVADRVYRHVALNSLGLNGAAGLSAMPLFNTARMDMATTDSDPCRKYFRLPVGEGEQENGNLTAAALTQFQGLITTYFGPVITGARVVSGKGNPVVAASFSPRVQMRQLHRRKRKVTP